MGDMTVEELKEKRSKRHRSLGVSTALTLRL